MKIYEPRPYRPVILDPQPKPPRDCRLAKGADGTIMPIQQARDSWRWKRESQRSMLKLIVLLPLLPIALVMAAVLAIVGLLNSGDEK